MICLPLNLPLRTQRIKAGLTRARVQIAPCKHDNMRDPLRRKWNTLCDRAAVTDSQAVARVLDDVLSRHAEPQRHHHTAEHVAEVLQTIEALADPSLPAVGIQLHAQDDYLALCFAGWLHDVVYDPTAQTNEEDSASYALECLSGLGVAPPITEEATRLIRLTAGHEVAHGDLAGMVLADADLAILAARKKRYARYAEAIRREHSSVDEDTYRAVRTHVLRGFLDRGSIYCCELMVTRCDTPARVNLQRELDVITNPN